MSYRGTLTTTGRPSRRRRDVASVPPPPDPAEFARRYLGFTPDEKQAHVLCSTARRGILNCTRQWGKSTVLAAKVVHRAYTQPNQMVLVASPSRRQSGEFLRKATAMALKLGIHRKGDSVNDGSFLFPNGSRIVALPGLEETIRGFSAVSLLVLDEAARVEDSMYKALRPMLAVSGGEIWMMSTPCGKRGFFYENWVRGGDHWLRISVPATECPRIPPEFLEEERAQLGANWFQQEYMCEFVDCGVGIFDRELIESAIDPRVRKLDIPRLRDTR